MSDVLLENYTNLLENYTNLLEDLKQQVQQACTRVALSVNRELILLYWKIGGRILEVQGADGWTTLPKPQSDLAQQLLKDPYNFDFLGLHDSALEREIEHGLVAHLKKFLLELGAGFVFLGNQYHLTISGQDFYIDLLFYHVKLHCYVVIELKAREFAPEDAGKLNFYLAAVDGELATKGDNPTIGLLLCRTKDKLIAEYSVKNINAPLGISEYQLGQALPNNLADALPSIAELEAHLSQLEVTHE